MDELTIGQKRFCEEYVKSYRATEAYMIAYPKSAQVSANTSASRLLKEQKIRDYIAQLEKDIYEEKRINYEHIASTLADMAFHDEDKRVRLKAIDLLQKQLGLQSQKISADISTDINIKIE